MAETIDDKMARWSTHFFNGFPESPEETDYTEYCLYRINVYKQNEWFGEEPANIFVDDFEGFNSNAFLNAHKDTRKRSVLRQRGIFIHTARSIRIADALADLISTGFVPWLSLELPDRPAISLMTPTDAEKFKEHIRHEVSQSSFPSACASMGPNETVPLPSSEQLTTGQHEVVGNERKSAAAAASQSNPRKDSPLPKRGQASTLFKAYEGSQEKDHGKPLENFERKQYLENFERKLINFKDKCAILLGGIALTFSSRQPTWEAYEY